MTQTTIWLLIVETQYGTNSSVHPTLDDARIDLVSFCKEWWEHEGVKGDPSTMSNDDIVDAYFDNMSGVESFTIDEISLPAGYCLTKIKGDQQ